MTQASAAFEVPRWKAHKARNILESYKMCDHIFAWFEYKGLHTCHFLMVGDIEGVRRTYNKCEELLS